jgi:hypothetical protein
MPNWCYNSVTLSHEDKTKIDALEAELQKENAEPFNHLCPRPAEEEENWYGWNVNNWGTKWDVSPHDWERETDNIIYINFDSAWSPPINLYEFLESEGWTVSAKYHEPGMGFVGAYQDGYDDYYELDWTDRESLENLPEDLADFANVWDDLERYEEEQMEEKLSELERTEWYDPSVNPERVGRYEVETAAWPYPQYSNWDGKKWGRWEGDDAVITRWRGLVEEYSEEEWDPVAELDKIVDETKVD